MSARKATVHRDGLEGLTECGKPFDGLTVQPADGSGPPVTCGSCRRLLTSYCNRCHKTVVCIRRAFWARSLGANHDSIQNLALHCPDCDHRCDWGVYPGKRAQERKLREQRSEARTARLSSTAIKEREWQDQWNAERADRAEQNVLLDGCAVCGAKPPLDPRDGWDQRKDYRSRVGAIRGWQASRFDFLQWLYCPEHAEVGRQLELTLVATFRGQAAAVREQVLNRMVGVYRTDVREEG